MKNKALLIFSIALVALLALLPSAGPVSANDILKRYIVVMRSPGIPVPGVQGTNCVYDNEVYNHFIAEFMYVQISQVPHRFIEFGWIKQTDPYEPKLSFYYSYQFDSGYKGPYYREEEIDYDDEPTYEVLYSGGEGEWQLKLDGEDVAQVEIEYNDGIVGAQCETEDSASHPVNELEGHFWDLKYRSGSSWVSWQDMDMSVAPLYDATQEDGDEFYTAGPSGIIGVTGAVNCSTLAGVTVELSKSGWQDSATSDNDGNYAITTFESGEYDVTASKSGFRQESQTIEFTDPPEVHTIDFLAETGLVPNAPDVFYVLECIDQWLYPESPCELTVFKVLEVVNAWLYPIDGKGAEGGKIEPLSGITVSRDVSSMFVRRGDTYVVQVRFTAPADGFNAIGLMDFAPEGWNVTVDATWSDPDAFLAKAVDNKAEIGWGGAYRENRRLVGNYRFTVPEDAPMGWYRFGDGLLGYYVGEDGPYTSEIGGDFEVFVMP
jgi:hypothetical protein